MKTKRTCSSRGQSENPTRMKPPSQLVLKLSIALHPHKIEGSSMLTDMGALGGHLSLQNNSNLCEACHICLPSCLRPVNSAWVAQAEETKSPCFKPAVSLGSRNRTYKQDRLLFNYLQWIVLTV